MVKIYWTKKIIKRVSHHALCVVRGCTKHRQAKLSQPPQELATHRSEEWVSLHPKHSLYALEMVADIRLKQAVVSAIICTLNFFIFSLTAADIVSMSLYVCFVVYSNSHFCRHIQSVAQWSTKLYLLFSWTFLFIWMLRVVSSQDKAIKWVSGFPFRPNHV